ncbi:Rhodanese-like domain-containing protein [Mariannaea sp. PMI_226]|nr:Rhodanese-like domain-containing protein [Mariannaea sp. PMI_226]
MAGEPIKSESGKAASRYAPDAADAENPIIHHFTKPTEAIPRITKATLAEILNGSRGSLSAPMHIIDCRFQYEYDGGHINGALNYDDHAELVKWLFKNPKNPRGGAMLIFHCEYSLYRAPRMADYVRDYDRHLNIDRYPHLTYGSIFVLDGGYRDFFASFPASCIPQSYVEMSDERYWTPLLERQLARFKDRKKVHNPLKAAIPQQTRKRN